MKPDITGFVVKDTMSVNTINVSQSLSGKISIKFLANDVIPCNATSIVSVLIKDSSDAPVKSDTISFETFLNADSKTCGDGAVFNDNSNIWTWEGQTGRAFSPGTSDSIANVSISIFSNLSSFNLNGTYTIIFNLNYVTDNLISDSKQFSVIIPSSDIEFPQITNINFRNENNSLNFMKTQYVNCTAKVLDTDSSSVIVSYIMYGSNSSKTSITNPGKTGTMDCTGDLWSTGKICSVRTKVGISDLGYWNCTVKADDGTNKNYKNSSVLLMINSPPVLSDEIENITVDKNENYTNFDLDDYFDDPDSQKLNYSVDGNDNVDIEIEDNGDVVFSPANNWTGTEIVIFTAEDEKGAETKSNNVSINVVDLLNCTSSWYYGNWSTCLNGTRARSYSDLNNCTIQTSVPASSETCNNVVATCLGGDTCLSTCAGGDPDCSCTIQNGYICGGSQNCSSIIDHNGIGVCCSVPCISVINTLENAGESGFFSTQTNKIIFGVGTIAAVVFICALIIILSTFIKRKKAIVSEQPEETIKEEKPVEITPVKIKPTNIDKMKQYIEQSLVSKVPIRIVKSELEKVGWLESDIDKELNIARLRNYIQIKLNQGIPRNEVEQSLKMKGWKKEQVEEASKNTKVRPLI